jgi:hypothetical protein
MIWSFHLKKHSVLSNDLYREMLKGALPLFLLTLIMLSQGLFLIFGYAEEIIFDFCALP